jgi:hypothetical protein
MKYFTVLMSRSILVLLVVCLSALYIMCSELPVPFEVVGVRGLNPENDPVLLWDSDVCGIRGLDPESDPIYTPTAQQVSKLDSFSIDTCDYSITTESKISSPSIFPETSPVGVDEDVYEDPRKYENVSASDLHVPEKCRKYIRQWNFYPGAPSDDTFIKGWVSCIGFTQNLMSDLKLSTKNSSYTLIPAKYFSKSKVHKNLSEAIFVALPCPSKSLFGNLFLLSSVLDSELRSLILAVHIIFDQNEDFIIKIIVVKSTHNLESKLHRKLLEVRRDIGEYQNY